MSITDNAFDNNEHHHDDYGDDGSSGFRRPENGEGDHGRYETYDDTNERINEDEDMDSWLIYRPEAGWNIVSPAGSESGDEGADTERMDTGETVESVHSSTYRPMLGPSYTSLCPRTFMCDCPCHDHTPSAAQTPNEPVTPSPEGLASPSSTTVELSSGEYSPESSMYLSRTLSFGELARLMGAHLQSQRYFFLTTPLMVNGGNVMPRPPTAVVQYIYPTTLSIHEEDNRLGWRK